MLKMDIRGWIDNKRIKKDQKSAIEHSPIASINAVVLHRTGSQTASSVLNAWNSKKEGTHFLISENGDIYQTASLKRQCWHVGKLYSKCRTTTSCTADDAKALENILKTKNISWGKKFRLVTKSELTKSYPNRFPHNHDSLGVEIVGLLSKDKEIYELPNKKQLSSLFWLLDELVTTYSLSIKDIYAHGKIAHKDKNKSEGASSLKVYTLKKAG
ncbi:MAG: peptidoglycan recognition family protein [Pseudomonadota bacterium]